MKKSLVLLALVAACQDVRPGGQETTLRPGPARPAQDGGVATNPDAGVTTEDAGVPLRTVEEDTSMFGTTSVGNLLMDPLFRGGSFSSMGFLALSWTGEQAELTWSIPFEAATPSRTSGATALARGEPVELHLVSMFSGGRGPFYADVWATLEDDRADVTADAIRVQVGEAWIGLEPGARLHQLAHVPGDDVRIGRRAWFHYAGVIDADLPATSAFLISSLRSGADLLAAGPQVVPLALQPFFAATGQLPAPRATRAQIQPVHQHLMRRVQERMPALESPRRVMPRPTIRVSPAPTPGHVGTP
ncbi:MAG: hypothetical protein AB2A00_00625 [Myxococcota bacterium]